MVKRMKDDEELGYLFTGEEPFEGAAGWKCEGHPAPSLHYLADGV